MPKAKLTTEQRIHRIQSEIDNLILDLQDTTGSDTNTSHALEAASATLMAAWLLQHGVQIPGQLTNALDTAVDKLGKVLLYNGTK